MTSHDTSAFINKYSKRFSMSSTAYNFRDTPSIERDQLERNRSSGSWQPYDFNNNQSPPVVKKSISFFSRDDLVNLRSIPLVGSAAYLASSVGAVAMDETLVKWAGSEYKAANVYSLLTFGSWAGIACYIYGRRHIRHAGAFEKMIYPTFTTTCFLAASQFTWALIRKTMQDQETFDYHWACVGGIASGLLLLYTGRRYLRFIDQW